MESRLRVLLLTGLLALTSGCSLFGRDEPPMEDASASAPVISPEVERRKIKTPKIDTENFELGPYGGLLSVEDFGTASLLGARAKYHVTEALFLEGTFGRSAKLGKSSAEALFNVDLLGADRTYQYYDLSLGYKIFPGETFIGRRWAFNSALYVIGGAGQTSFGPDDYFTLSFGAGYQVLATDWLALDFGVRDHVFDQEITGENKVTHNIELTLGINFFF